MRRRRTVSALALATVAVLAGCGALFGNPARPTTTVTPVSVEEPATPTTTPTAQPTPGEIVRQPRYHDLRPTCDRPPGLVIHIQVESLANNDPATNRGINTTWQFAAPSNRQVTGPYPEFVRLIRQNFEPLLDAESISYGPLQRNGDSASREVTVTGPGGQARTYEWLVERQSGGRYDGCWMTTGVRALGSPGSRA